MKRRPLVSSSNITISFGCYCMRFMHLNLKKRQCHSVCELCQHLDQNWIHCSVSQIGSDRETESYKDCSLFIQDNLTLQKTINLKIINSVKGCKVHSDCYNFFFVPSWLFKKITNNNTQFSPFVIRQPSWVKVILEGSNLKKINRVNLMVWH